LWWLIFVLLGTQQLKARCVMAKEPEEGLTHFLQFHSCVVTSEGGVKCWGGNGHGQVMLYNLLSVASCNSAFDVAGEQPAVADGVFICSWEMGHQPIGQSFQLLD
jgi:hypothetical protein